MYEPAHVFPAEQRARWGVGQGPDPAWADVVERAERAAQAERKESWRRLVRGRRGRYPAARAAADLPRGGVAEDEEDDPLADHARALWVDGVLLLCPASLGGGAGPRRALVRGWDLPLPWLLVVGLGGVPAEPDGPVDGATDGAGNERAEEVADGRCAGGPSVKGWYLAPMWRTRTQAARVLRILRITRAGTEVVAEVEVLARWLEGFHPRSWLELDTRPVVSLLAGDDGLDDARLGMECLASGDTMGADAAYQRLRQRSRVLTDISRLS